MCADQARGSHRAGRFWSRLTDAERATFEDVGNWRRYARGEVLIQISGTGQWAAILRSGRVRVIGGDGVQVLATRWAGDIVGEQARLDGQPRSATVVAETAVQALVLGEAKLEHVFRQHPRVLRVLGAVMSERLREADRKLIGQADGAFTKVVEELLRHADERGHPVEQGVRVHIRSQADLGKALGVSRDSVVRVLRQLRAEKIITTRRGLVTIHDLAGLRGRALR
jgi:CRP/FNR family cyclic AMP-dependent transcriptional regulator